MFMNRPDEMIVVIEVPGIDPATIDLTVTGNILSVRGVKEPGDLPEPLLVLRERRFGPFIRQLTLPDDVDFDKAQAEAKEGVLVIRLPKPSAVQPRTIPIRPELNRLITVTTAPTNRCRSFGSDSSGCRFVVN